jgi:sulfatase modifying factor 1
MCSNGACAGSTTTGTSCEATGNGLSNCGATQENCCTSLEVTGGTYFRAYDPFNPEDAASPALASDGGPADESHLATVSTFRLDKYEVTVGRFRQFVNAWNGGAGYQPAATSGKHPYLNGGQGLANSGSPGTYETGWTASWSANIAPTNANLNCPNAGFATWTDTASSQDNLPINCVNWYEAYAFCIWDGGFLPSEAEWEYAAAGGSEQRYYPWGSTPPGTSNRYAIYLCQYGISDGGLCTGVTNIAPVGTATLGAGLWGQLDLAGEVYNWTLDVWSLNYVDPCTDCAYLTNTSQRVVRGGDFGAAATYMFPPARDFYQAASRYGVLGLRCARSP